MATWLLTAALALGLLSGHATAAQPTRAPVVKGPVPAGPPRVVVDLLTDV